MGDEDEREEEEKREGRRKSNETEEICSTSASDWHVSVNTDAMLARHVADFGEGRFRLRPAVQRWCHVSLLQPLLICNPIRSIGSRIRDLAGAGSGHGSVIG